MNNQMEDMHRARYGERASASMPSPGDTDSLNVQELSGPSPLGFYGGFIA